MGVQSTCCHHLLKHSKRCWKNALLRVLKQVRHQLLRDLKIRPQNYHPF
ncbi:MAG TPA: hypothetical protein DCR35_21750 [Runella sp.]|nr:hypothetical protein [Runella sp.]HAO51710.1 hypothetical protein [Runella sp.]